MKHQKYFKCPSCKNLKLEKRNRSYEFVCEIFGLTLDSLIKNNDFSDCCFYIPKNKNGGDVLQPSIIFVGKKEISRYLLACLRALETSSRVLLRARGRLISKAVDVAETVRNKLLPGTVVKDVKINTVFRDGKRVSEIEITLAWGGFRGNVG